jgi:ParB family chromosome partitioning protein
MLALAVIENIQREDLNPLESAEAYRQLVADFGLTQAEVAGLVGKSRVAVTNTLRLLGLAPDVRALVAGGRLSEGHGRALLGLGEPEAQLALARRAVVGEWTVRRTEAEVRTALERDPVARRPRTGRGTERPVDPNEAAAVRQLEARLGTRVELRRQGDGGTLVIHFYSEEELSGLYDRLIGEGFP